MLDLATWTKNPGAAMRYRRYDKVKEILGGREFQTEYINRTIAHRGCEMKILFLNT